MIEIREIDGRSCPLVICDSCGRPITETGIVAETKTGLRFYHKKAQSPGCDRDDFLLWYELSYFLPWLCENAKVSPDDFEEAREQAGLL